MHLVNRRRRSERDTPSQPPLVSNNNNIMSANQIPRKLRLITYMVPSIPLELFQVYQEYLEEALGMDSYLTIESRISGPPEGKIDPFTADEMDLGFLCSTPFLRLMQEQNKHIELIEAAPIHVHPKSELRPVYYSDIIVHADKDEDKYKSFDDLKGHTWAYNDNNSLSGNLAVMAELKRLGTNASFFGHTLHSGSHINSIQLVLTNTVDAAAIDSSTLKLYLLSHPEHRKKLRVITSLGPLPIQPVIVNKRLPAELKKKITSALLQMNKVPKWNEKLAQYGVWGFKPIDISLYDQETELKDVVKSMSLQAVYY